VNVARLLDDASVQISTALGLEKREARIEARVLAGHAWRVDGAWLIAHDTDPLTDEMLAPFQTLLTRRLEGVPIAYLLGSREFYGRPFAVSPDVLIPRPDTELLVELALERIPPDRSVDVLDLGTGSGCIAITLALERPLARVTAVDRSSAALAIAQRNAEILDARVEFLTSDWFERLDGKRFDLIVSNPPYIAESDPHLNDGDVRFEPRNALVSGVDGLDDLMNLISLAPRHLTREGWLLLEHGYDQGPACQTLFSQHNLRNIDTLADLSGHPRVTIGCC
jgi:release factor glutamine methyltransferase